MVTADRSESTSCFAEEQQPAPASEDDVQAKMQKDKTGTNPINFQREFRIYNEYPWLNTAGDGSQNLTTFEYRTPFADGKWQWRTRARHNNLTAEVSGDGIDDIDSSGLGDIDMRFLTVPVIDIPNRQAWAFGMEVFLNTADDDALGSGATSLGPQVFWANFLKNKQGLFAPAVQYKFSIDEDAGRSKVDQYLVDLNYLWIAKDKSWWFFADPQIVIDNENNTEFGVVDVEVGYMLQPWFKQLKGHSFYIRPSIGVGNDRPMDGSIAFGYKIVGF